MTTLSLESTVSHYKIKSLIARGGMGEVYKAVDLQLGRVVALKTILPARATDPNIYHRFLREARAASILAHPSICTIYEIGEAGDLTFIAMQYLEGKTIENLIAQGPMRIESALGYALDVAEALEEAHRHGVVHRDIKPSNIIVNERNTAVVLDFGLAKQVTFAGGMNDELPTQMQLTASATLVGTGPYMAPEQILGEPPDGRSDIFSFGVTLYEMLGGIRPFEGLTTVDVLHSILHDEPKPLARVRPEVDQGLAAIISKMLAKKPDARYQTAREFSDELLNYIYKKGYAVRGSSGSRRDDNASSLRRTAIQLQGSASTKATEVGSRWRLPLGLLFAIALLAGLWWFISQPRGGPDQNLPSSLRYVQLVNWKSEPGELHSDAVFSRDGRIIAFSSRRGKFRDIWIKQTKMGDPNQVTKGEWNSWNPIWSPDNQQIAFLSKRGNQSGIWRMPALGGTPVLVGGAMAGNVRLKYWSLDGRTIYYELTPNLFSLDLATGKATQITNDSHADQTSYSISPDEARVAFVDLRNGQKDLWVRPIREGSPIQVTNDSFEDRSPIWHPDGQRIIYSSIRDGVYQICVAFVDGRPPIQLTSGESDKFLLDVSFDGSSILHAASNEESDIWSVTVNAEETEVTAEPGAELWPAISPDGNTIAYQSVNNPAQTRKLRDSVILTRPTGREGQKVQLAVGGVNPTSAPDGTTVAFVRWSDNMWNVWTVRATGGDEKQLTKRGVFEGSTVLPYNRVGTRFYSWSPDGSKITYLSQGDTEAGLWVISTDGSHDTAITSNLKQSLYGPMWSPDGKQVAFVAAENQPGDRSWGIWLADLNSRKQHVVLKHSSAMSLLGWLGGAEELLVATSETQGIIEANPIDVRLISVPNKGGAGKPIATLNSAYLHNIQLSPNGQSVAFASRQDGKDNIWLTSAKGGEARKLTSNTDPRLYFSSMAFSPDGQKIYFGKQSSSTLISMIENFK